MQYLPNLQQQPNNWRQQQQQPYQRLEFNNHHKYPQQYSSPQYQNNYRGKNFNHNYNNQSFNWYNESYKRWNPEETTNYQQPRNNYQPQQHRPQQQQEERQQEQQNYYQQPQTQQKAIANRNDRWCEYHNQYQQNARNCQPPCRFFSDNGIVPPANLLIQPQLDQQDVNSCTVTTVTKKKEKIKTIMLLPDVSGTNYLVDTGTSFLRL